MKLYIVRHGEATSNKEGYIAGHMDVELTQEGLTQAKLVAQWLSSHSFDVAFSSDLQRTLVTAHEIMKFHEDLSLEQRISLRERDVYDLAWKNKTELAQEFGVGIDEIYTVLLDEWRIESNNSLIERAWLFFEFLKEEYNDRTILLVNHWGLIKALLTHIFGEHPAWGKCEIVM